MIQQYPFQQLESWQYAHNPSVLFSLPVATLFLFPKITSLQIQF